jgi:hypothetical protein
VNNLDAFPLRHSSLLKIPSSRIAWMPAFVELLVWLSIPTPPTFEDWNP